MALPAQEPFTGTGALSGNWTQQTTDGTIVASADQGANNNTGIGNALWSADVFTGDQYAQLVVKVMDATPQYFGPTVRASGTAPAENGYQALVNQNSGSVSLYKLVAGTYTLLATLTATIVVNDVVRIEAIGTTLRVKQNGVQIGTDTTDSGLATGSAGVLIRGSVNRVDDWEGGNLGGAVGGWSVYRPYTLGSAIAALTTGSLFYYWRRRKQEKPDE